MAKENNLSPGCQLICMRVTISPVRGFILETGGTDKLTSPVVTVTDGGGVRLKVGSWSQLQQGARTLTECEWVKFVVEK